MHSNRLEIIRAIRSRATSQAHQESPQNKKISEIFGNQTFRLEEMQKRLSPEDFTTLKKIIANGDKLSAHLAKTVAEAVRSWATGLGATHFTHWFQPMTGLTAEKHDSFLSFDDKGHAIEKFSASQLIQSEPDASSFPSGGTRSTFEARGYTAWDVSAPIFVVDHAGTKTLCIPSVFVSYTGHSLDFKTGLMRSIDKLGSAAVSLLKALDHKTVESVVTTIGCEQEYFLIDSDFAVSRPDLLLSGRTLIGGDMPKGQQLEDHYFGAIPSRVLAYMADVEYELYQLGVPVKTRHNEVAPSQFEMAPIFEEASLASDHNMLTMEVLQRVAERHNFVCLLHEKPFAGVNGSGKHCNWSLATDSGENLLEPGNTPHSNFRFLAVLSCVLKAVHGAQIGLRAAIASHGNDHRLGANEAPPAIISVFLGSELTKICEKISTGEDLSKLSAEKAMIDFGLNRLPSIPKDNTDRNRTSPFAFTGNKFEFRAVGSSQAIALPVTILNAAVASAMAEFERRLNEKKKTASSVDTAALEIAKEFIMESQAVRFEGDGYSGAWRQEAKKRGLHEILKTPESYEEFLKKEHHDYLLNTGVYSEEEFHALIEVRLERYVKHLSIEAQTLVTLVKQHVLPASMEYFGKISSYMRGADGVAGLNLRSQKHYLSELSELVESCFDKLHRLQNELNVATEKGGALEAAKAYAHQVAPLMSDLRGVCDRLEATVADELWPLPKYREMLFIR